MAAFEQLGGDVVVKPLFGSEGRGIARLQDEALAERAFRMIAGLGGRAVSPRIHSSRGLRSAGSGHRRANVRDSPAKRNRLADERQPWGDRRAGRADGGDGPNGKASGRRDRRTAGRSRSACPLATVHFMRSKSMPSRAGRRWRRASMSISPRVVLKYIESMTNARRNDLATDETLIEHGFHDLESRFEIRDFVFKSVFNPWLTNSPRLVTTIAACDN